MSRTRHNKPVPTHLIVGNSLSESFDELRDLSGISALVYEPGLSALCQHFLRTLLDFIQRAAKEIGEDERGEKSANVPGQLFASLCLLRVSVDHCRGNVLFKPLQLGLKVFDILLNIIEMLKESMSAVRNNHYSYRQGDGIAPRAVPRTRSRSTFETR